MRLFRSLRGLAIFLLGAWLALPVSASGSTHGHSTRSVLAPKDQAYTFAQARQHERIATLLVLEISGNAVTAIDLSAINGHYSHDAFDLINSFPSDTLDRLAAQTRRGRTYPLGQLIGVGPTGLSHIAAGTNYAQHGDEVGLDEAFLFPKLSPAGGPRAKISAQPGVLLDYEVEICARFDREIRSIEDFDAARKGFFLCGDFSDRAAMLRGLKLTDILSGDGFPDAKSGADRFPAGAFLVVPRDWRAFLAGTTIATYVDGQRRQNARGESMIKDLRTIVRETLAEAGSRTWSYKAGRIPMVSRPAIGTDSAILTGTGAGVIFQQPDEALVKEVMSAADRGGQLKILDRYIASEGARKIYLQPGQRVRYEGNYLGRIDVEVVGGAAAR